MNEYVECSECTFVYLAADGDEPWPKGQDACPNCDGTSFAFVD